MSHGEITISYWPLTVPVLACPRCGGQGNGHGLGCSHTKHRPELERELTANLREHEIEAVRAFRVLDRRPRPGLAVIEDEPTEGDYLDAPHYLIECTARRCPVFFWLRKPELGPVRVYESVRLYRGKAIPDGLQVIEHQSGGLCPGDWVRIANHVHQHRKEV